MKRLCTILLCAAIMPFVMASCEKSVELDYLTKHPANTDGPKDGKTPQALLFYFVGTGLDYYFEENINALKRAVDRNIPGDGRIAYFRRKSGREWSINEIYYDASAGMAAQKELKSYPDADLSDMCRYLSDMIELVPAESYGVVFGGHGSGWIPKSEGNSWYNKYSVGSQSAYIAPFGELPREDALPTRFFGESAVMFDLDEIAADMIATGVRYDYVIFDDCFMSNIESLYAMRRATDYIIASPCEIMAEGFPYELVVPYLFTDKGHNRDLAGVCSEFYNYYMNVASYKSGCVALTVCSELEELAVRYANLLSGLTNNVNRSELQYYEGLSEHLFYDFGQYAELVSANPVLLNDFKEQFDRAFPVECRLHTPSFYTAFGYSYNSLINVDYYSGVTTSEPAGRNQELHRQTEWYRATHR